MVRRQLTREEPWPGWSEERPRRIVRSGPWAWRRWRRSRRLPELRVGAGSQGGPSRRKNRALGLADIALCSTFLRSCGAPKPIRKPRATALPASRGHACARSDRPGGRGSAGRKVRRDGRSRRRARRRVLPALQARRSGIRLLPRQRLHPRDRRGRWLEVGRHGDPLHAPEDGKGAVAKYFERRA